MKTWTQFLAESENHSYSCVMAMLPKNIADKIIKWGKENIPNNDLAEEGRELDPHVTVLYGLHTNKLQDIKDCFKDAKPIKLKVGKVSMFTNNDDFNVVNYPAAKDGGASYPTNSPLIAGLTSGQ